MGSVVKHVTSALTGHSGSQSQTTKENSTSNQSQQSWLESNPQYQALQNQGLSEAQNFNMPQYQLAGSNTNLNQSLAGLAQGVDASGYNNAYKSLSNQGESLYNTGLALSQQGANKYQTLGNTTQTDVQNMLKSEFNSDLVNSQMAAATSDITDQYNSQVQSLNQNATMHGDMGSTRAGVAQGVLGGQAQKAIANASVNYRTAEESAATNRVMNYLGLQQNAAQNLASIGNSQQAMGLQQYGAGMGYYSQYNQALTQNLQNQFTAGQFQQTQAQQAIDVARQNEILRQSPSLARLSYYNQTYLPMASLSSTGTGTSSGTNVTTSPGQGGNLLGGLMGMGGSMLGTYFGGATGGQIGGMVGGAFGNSYGR